MRSLASATAARLCLSRIDSADGLELSLQGENLVYMNMNGQFGVWSSAKKIHMERDRTVTAGEEGTKGGYEENAKSLTESVIECRYRSYQKNI